MPNASNPLSSLPSVLAIRDIRRRVRRAFAGNYVDSTRVRHLLALDPPAVLRGLRAASAPIYGVRRDDWTVPLLAETLGTSLTRRMLDVAPIDIAGTGPIRRLWLHAIATAHAAKGLAETSGVMDPEEAYLLGLLHDLPLWLHFLGLRHRGEPPQGTVAEWLRHWRLPEKLSRVIDEVMFHRGSATGSSPTDPTTLIAAAELLAELADFCHPEGSDQLARDMLLTAISKDDFVAAQRLRREVQTTLQQVGLDLSLPEPDVEMDRGLREELDLFPGKHNGDTSEVVLAVLGCSKSGSYRGIVTAITSSALRFMGYDRAWYVKWAKGSGRLAIRAKSDLSARRVTTIMIEPTQEELTAIQRAIREEHPARTEIRRNGAPGLLHWIGADEVLLVPVNREFETPALLVLDRALSARPIQLLQDAEMASTLGLTATLLNENLLLKRRQQRATKFALTDPLTRLFNRSMGIKTLDQEISRSVRTNSPLSVLMVDLDEFKKINDQHGHLQGDVTLRATAEVLRKTLRKVDTICRYGGEEFMVVLPGTSPEDAAILATRLFIAVEARGIELQMPVTVSLGLATFRAKDTVETLLHRADQALYASKSLGRNRFSVDVDG